MYDKLTAGRVKTRLGTSVRGPRYEQAALLYARFSGVTDEPEYLRIRCKEHLDQVIDAMKPDEWTHAEQIVTAFGEPLFRDLVQYGITRSCTQEKRAFEAAKAVEHEPDDEREP